MSVDDADLEKNTWEDFVTKNVNPANPKKMFEAYKTFKKRSLNLPLSEMKKLGWISENQNTSHFTSLFKEIYFESKSLYRKSDSSDTALVSAWLSRVRSQAELQVLSEMTPEFIQIGKKDLKDIAHLSVKFDVIKKLPSLLAQHGIILVYQRSLPATKIDGAVFKLRSGHPVIGMSLRYSRLDYFWFTLLHELSHVHLHWDELDTPIIDNLDEQSEAEIEIAANRLAKNSFVERSSWRNCEPKYNTSVEALDSFATKAGIHRSIVAGFLRHETKKYTLYSDIVNEYDVRELLFEDG